MKIKYVFLILVGLAIFSFFFFKEALAQDSCSIENTSPECQDNSSINQGQNKGEIQVYFFYTQGCSHCKKVEDKLKELSKKYSLEQHGLDAKKESQIFKNLLKNYNVPFKKWGQVPIVFVGDKYLFGEDEILRNLEPAIKNAQETGKTKILDQSTINSQKFNLGSIALLGLVDSINPCALAIFLLLLLTLAEEKNFAGRNILTPAFFFILAVFLSYFVFGFLIVSGFREVTSINLAITYWIYKGAAVLALILGVLSIREFYLTRAGTCKATAFFGLEIKNILDKAFSAFGMFVTGILISVFLLPCSSGPYFVAGGLLSQETILRSVFWLSYYNLIFVLPMILITILVSFALFEVGKISHFVSKNNRYFTLADGLLLIILGIWVLLT